MNNERPAAIAASPLLAAVKSLKIESKNKLMAIWFSKERIEGSQCLDTLFCLDDYWQSIYNEYRISKGFSAATVIANDRVLSFVYGS